MSKHTPGPWTASVQRDRQGRDLGWIVDHPNGRIAWPSLAYLKPNKAADYDDPAREANAHLIAAAPDLLEALKAMVVEQVDYMTINKLGDPEQQHNIKLARAAIAKAEGREP